MLTITVARSSKRTKEASLRILPSSVIFVDPNVFVHAYLKPKRSLTSVEAKIKQSAKSIVSRINRGEMVLISVVHFSELSNIFEDNMSLQDAQSFERAVCSKENITMMSVTYDDYLGAMDEAERKQSAINNALIYVLMKKRGIDCVYSFDRDFDRFPDIKRLTA